MLIVLAVVAEGCGDPAGPAGELAQGARFDLPNALARDVEPRADRLQGDRTALAVEHVQDARLARRALGGERVPADRPPARTRGVALAGQAVGAGAGHRGGVELEDGQAGAGLLLAELRGSWYSMGPPEG